VEEVREVVEAEKQLALFGSQFIGLLNATELMKRVGELSDVTAAQVRESRVEYCKAYDTLAPFRRILDLYTSQWFGNDREEVLEFLRTKEAEAWVKNPSAASSKLDDDQKALVTKADEATRQHRLFHWDLAYPEVFYEKDRRKENPGFDAVIGNPPWGAQLPSSEKFWYKTKYETVAKGIIDNFALFLQLFTDSCRRNGLIGILLPDIVLLKNYPTSRRFILFNHLVKEVVHWGQPFQDVNLDVCSILSKRFKDAPDITKVRCVVDIKSWIDHNFTENYIQHSVFRKNDDFRLNLYLNEALQNILDKIHANSVPLSNYLEFHEGIHSGNIRSKLFVDQPISKKCKPLIFGRDEVRAFSLNWSGKYVVYDNSIINKNEGEYANLGHEYYFLKPKLLVRRTGDRIIAVTDEDKFFASNNLFVGLVKEGCTIPLEFFEGLLNSKFATQYFRAIQPRKGRLFAELKIIHLNKVPVPKRMSEAFVDKVVHKVRSIKALVAETDGSKNELVDKYCGQLDYLFASPVGLSSEETQTFF